MRGTRVEQSVSIGAQTAFFHRGDSDLTIDRNTWVGRGLEGDIGYTVNPGDPGGMPRDTGYLLAGRIAGTVIVDVDFGLRRTSVPEVGTITHAYNDFFRVTTTHDSGFMQDPTELEVDPGYDVARYGDGAYLMPAPALMGLGEGGGDIGADVRYRLEDGVLTDVPLWPWPMEDRIDREQGVSVTYDSADGLFETLCDVY
jgi:hypothetical protein